LAVADWIDRNERLVTVQDLLEAMVKAYEIQGCFQTENAFHAHGMDHVILVKVASTAAACWLLRLTKKQTMDALSHAWMDSAPLRTYRSSPNTISRKGWAAGDACMRAVMFAMLCRSGVEGAPSALTAPRWGFYDSVWQSASFSLPRPYASWVIQNVFFKTMPAEGHGISAVEAAIQLSHEFRCHDGDRWKDIDKIRIRSTAATLRIISKAGPLHSPADRDHCIQFLVAVALLKGSAPEISDYADDGPWANNPKVDDLRTRMVVVEDESFTRDYLDLDRRTATNAVQIYFNDGTATEDIIVEHPVGHSKNPQTRLAVQRKFKDNLAHTYSKDEISSIISMIENEHLPVHVLIDLLARKSSSGVLSRL
jgi:2-methylcitrate dehydratase